MLFSVFSHHQLFVIVRLFSQALIFPFGERRWWEGVSGITGHGNKVDCNFAEIYNRNLPCTTKREMHFIWWKTGPLVGGRDMCSSSSQEGNLGDGTVMMPNIDELCLGLSTYLAMFCRFRRISNDFLPCSNDACE